MPGRSSCLISRPLNAACKIQPEARPTVSGLQPRTCSHSTGDATEKKSAIDFNLLLFPTIPLLPDHPSRCDSSFISTKWSRRTPEALSKINWNFQCPMRTLMAAKSLRQLHTTESLLVFTASMEAGPYLQQICLLLGLVVCELSLATVDISALRLYTCRRLWDQVTTSNSSCRPSISCTIHASRTPITALLLRSRKRLHHEPPRSDALKSRMPESTFLQEGKHWPLYPPREMLATQRRSPASSQAWRTTKCLQRNTRYSWLTR